MQASIPPPVRDVPESAADTAGPGGAAATTYTAKQSTLVWRAFKKHRLAMAGVAVTIAFYVVALFAEFLAPYSASRFDAESTFAPPQLPQIVDISDDGWDWGLHVNGYTSSMDQETYAQTYEIDESTKIPLRFFAKGESYEFWGLFETNIHLIGPADPDQPMYLLGTDGNGRDLLSRIIHATRVSMSIGLVGVTMTFVLGVVLGGISGYVGGKTDLVIQRLVEFFMSIPTLPLWLGLAAALPDQWGPLRRYFAITVILAIIGWTSLARETRGKFMSLREEEFVTSAHLDGNSQPRVIFRHILPSFTSHLIASLSLSIPAMILAETALSFLGMGLQAPVVSWGVLLQDAQDIRTVATAAWLLLPGLAVVAAVLALNFVGDGLRDAADPYKR
ncbi:ABC transporter permease [Jiangella asiatica]|uniref:ABC transporter permease n=1 Tax=Jiangella asiatica TaxID=2530372 RepID=A0A4V2Z116_9ACTN|nr:ABC transporter permease [Jiangella asiatica]TDE03098.1 ABC transporter permease [Jiangella asiatica]